MISFKDCNFLSSCNGSVEIQKDFEDFVMSQIWPTLAIVNIRMHISNKKCIRQMYEWYENHLDHHTHM